MVYMTIRNEIDVELWEALEKTMNLKIIKAQYLMLFLS